MTKTLLHVVRTYSFTGQDQVKIFKYKLTLIIFGNKSDLEKYYEYKWIE